MGAQPTYSYGAARPCTRFRRRASATRGARRASRNTGRSRRARDDLEQQVELDVRLAFDSVRSAATEVKTAQEGVELSEQELAQAREAV